MPYPRHAPLIAPARPSASLWHLAGGICLLVVLTVSLAMLYNWLCTALLPASAWGPDGSGVRDATTPWGALAQLYVFGLIIVALALSMTLAHRRRWAGLIGPPGIALAQFRRVLLILAALYAGVALLPMPDDLALTPHLELSRWLAFLPLALLGLVIQVSAEELVFRGYIQSQLAARFAHPVVWMVAPSALFGLLHHQPELLGDAAWLVVVWAALFGLATADLTARSGTLGPAIALHLVNNISAILLTAPAGSFDGLALSTYPLGPDHTDLLLAWMPVDLMLLLCSWLAARLALRV